MSWGVLSKNTGWSTTTAASLVPGSPRGGGGPDRGEGYLHDIAPPQPQAHHGEQDDIKKAKQIHFNEGDVQNMGFQSATFLTGHCSRPGTSEDVIEHDIAKQINFNDVKMPRSSRDTLGGPAPPGIDSGYGDNVIYVRDDTGNAGNGEGLGRDQQQDGVVVAAGVPLGGHREVGHQEGQGDLRHGGALRGEADHCSTRRSLSCMPERAGRNLPKSFRD